MFNKFIFDESSIFILLIQFHLHLISFHQRFPHYLHDIFFQNFQKKHLASARCSVKKFQFLPAYIFNIANIIFLISKYYFQLLRYGITRVDLALERLTLSYNEMLRVENTGRDRKKVKKLLYYISELSPKHLMKQKMDAYLFYVCVRQ